jgi:microcompartment protein CcmL/EutN
VNTSSTLEESTAEPYNSSAFGVLETRGWTPAMVALDAMEKAAKIELWQVELNDFLGTCIKIRGSVDAVRTAIDVGHAVAEQMQGHPVSTVIPRLSRGGEQGILSPVEFNPLIQQNVVKEPRSSEQTSSTSFSSQQETTNVSSSTIQALGFIETQGFTAVFEAIDTACKAAQVDVVGKEKLGGGYVTIVIRGDVAAVRAAIDAAKPKVEGLGKLIAAHVIARPSESVLALLPK